MSRNSLEEYDEELGLINIDIVKRPFSIIYRLLMISLSVFLISGNLTVFFSEELL